MHRHWLHGLTNGHQKALCYVNVTIAGKLAAPPVAPAHKRACETMSDEVER